MGYLVDEHDTSRKTGRVCPKTLLSVSNFNFLCCNPCVSLIFGAHPRSYHATWFLLFAYFPLTAVILFWTHGTGWFFYTAICLSMSLGSYVITCRLIPPFASRLQQRGLFGKDLNKPGDDRPPVPESLGLVASAMFLMSATAFQSLFSSDSSKLLEYNAGLLAVCCMTFLGFVDDVLDLRWRYKMILPFFASLSLVVAYRGPTTILIPSVLQKTLGLSALLNLGVFYRVYVTLLAVFCTNSINIYAGHMCCALLGINGLEVGQSLVMCVAVICHNLLCLNKGYALASQGWAASTLGEPLTQHFFSLLFSIPFFSCSLALLAFNWFPATVFVGDTYTYFAGMYFAVVGILGHFSKTLVLFFIPQVINFALSIPQILGPLSEKQLCLYLLIFQAICCALGLWVRHVVYTSTPLLP